VKSIETTDDGRQVMAIVLKIVCMLFLNDQV
jgi:hypothetical protein